jgi:hypothetical protein
MAVWAQPGLDDSIPLDILDATLAWGQRGGMTFTELLDFQNNDFQDHFILAFRVGMWQN